MRTFVTILLAATLLIPAPLIARERPSQDDIRLGAKITVGSGADSDALRDRVTKKLEKVRDKAEKAALKETKDLEKAGSKDRRAALNKLNKKLKDSFDAEMLGLTDDERVAVEYAEPNYRYDLDGYVPNDASLDNAWWVRSLLAQNDQLFSTPATLTRPVVVAVIDAGVDYNHEDLVGQMWSSALCADEYGVRKATGCTNGWDFIGNDGDPAPSDGAWHGTAVASLIGATTDNGKGIASVAQNRVQIMSLRVFNGTAVEGDAVTKAIYFAVYNGADIINMSLGGEYMSQAMADAVAFAQARGVTVVAAAGNYALNIDLSPVYPAVFPDVITVAATDRAGNLASFSNFGYNTTEVAAPGTGIYSGKNGNLYQSVNGTSFAAPIVTSYLARGLSEGRTASVSLAAIPLRPSLTGVKDGRALGAAITSDASLADVNPFLSLHGGGLLNVFEKGGALIGANGFTLFWATANNIKDPTLGLATQISPGVSYLSSPDPLNSPTSSNTTQTLSWSAVTGAGSYGVYLTRHDTEQVILAQESRLPSAGTSVTVTGLAPGVYRWNTAVSKLANTVTASTYNLTAVYFFRIIGATAPPASFPSTLTPNNTSSLGYQATAPSISLSWSSVTNATSYNVTVRDNYTGSFLYNLTSVSGLSMAANGLTAGHSYQWDVQACNSGGCSGFAPNRYFYVPATTAPIPAIPTGVVPSASAMPGTNTNNAGLPVSWSAVSGATSYNVAWTERTYPGDALVGSINQQTVTSPSFTIPAVPAGKYYRFDIGACNATGCSARTANSYFYNLAVVANPYDLQPALLTASTTSLAPLQSTVVSWAIKNTGTTNTGASTALIKLYDRVLATISVPGVPAGSRVAGFTSVTMPAATDSLWSGSGNYSLTLTADSNNVISEGTPGESNNTSNIYGTGAASVYVTLPPLAGTPTVTMTGIPTTVNANTPISVTFNTSNISIGSTVILSSNTGQAISPQSFTLTSSSVTKSITLSTPGEQILIFATVNGAKVGESSLTKILGTSVNPSTITLQVVDKNKTPMPNVLVGLTCAYSNSVDCATPPTPKTTNSYGNVTFIVPNPLNQYVMQITSTVTVVGVSTTERLGTVRPADIASYIQLQLVSQHDITHVPVVLVPGIMGSTAGTDAEAVPYMTGGTVQRQDLKISDKGWVGFVAGTFSSAFKPIGWTSLKQNLIASGYELGKTIIECPYDWRLAVTDATDQFLTGCVNEALDKNRLVNGLPNSKVDIVAHSQGGLLTRDYMQRNGGANAGNIRKVAFMATPHLGATEAYFGWEGGEANDARAMVLARTLEHSGLGNIGSFTDMPITTSLGLPTSQNTVCGVALTRTFGWGDLGVESSDLLKFSKSLKATKPGPATIDVTCSGYPTFPLPLTSSVGGGTADWVISNRKFTQAFIQQNAPSAKGLLPIYGFIKADNQIDTAKLPITTSVNQNTYLMSLSGMGTSAQNYVTYANAVSGKGVQTRMYFINKLASTAGLIVKGGTSSPLWNDGIPTERISVDGDETVPYNESIRPFLIDNPGTEVRQLSTGNHTTIITEAMNDLVPYITGTAPSTYALQADTSKIGFSVTGQVVVKVADPSGRVVGIDPVTGEGANGIADAEINIESGKNNIMIPSPIDGSYIVTISGATAGDYRLYSDYSSTGRSEPHEFLGYHRAGAVDTLVLSLNSAAASDKQVFVYSLDKAPANVQVMPSAGVSRVTWVAPASGSPSAYRVYTRVPGDAQVAYVAETTSLSYTTSYPFAGTSTPLLREFLVSSVINGSESFLSLPVLNNDTDGDRVDDATEASLGSSLTNTDTDADGLTDGQEYVLFGTSPTLADSDNNGVSDKNQISAVISTALASSTASTTPPVTASSTYSVRDTGSYTTIADSWNLGTTSGEQGQSWVASTSYMLGRIGLTMTRGLGYAASSTANVTIYRGLGTNRTIAGTTTIQLDSVPASANVNTQSEFLITFANAIQMVAGQIYSYALQVITGHYNDQLRMGTGDPTFLNSNWMLLAGSYQNTNLRRQFVTYNVATSTASSTPSTNTPPTMIRNGANPMILYRGTPFVDPGVVAADAEDGVLAVQSNAQYVNTAIAQTYTVSYSAQDSAGQIVSLTRTVRVLVPPLENVVDEVAIGGIADTFNVGTSGGEQGQAWTANKNMDLWKVGIRMARGLSFIAGRQATFNLYKDWGLPTKSTIFTTTIDTDTLPPTPITQQDEYGIVIPAPIKLDKGTIYAWTLQVTNGHYNDQLRIGADTPAATAGLALINVGSSLTTMRRPVRLFGVDLNLTMNSFELMSDDGMATTSPIINGAIMLNSFDDGTASSTASTTAPLAPEPMIEPTPQTTEVVE